MKRENVSPVAQWLIRECADRDLSWAEASKRAGVDRATISLIVRGARPGMEICRAMARLFDVPVTAVLALAGHLEGSAVAPVLHPAVRRMALEIESLPADVQKPLLEAWEVMLKTARAAAGHREPPTIADDGAVSDIEFEQPEPDNADA